MKLSAKIILPLALVTVLAGCASQRGWTPVVDTQRDKNIHSLNADLAICKQMADQAADQGGEMAESGAIGALGGAAGGALLGAIAGDPGMGAAIGAVSGTGIGLASSGSSSNTAFKQAYINCLRQRGHPVIN